MMNKLSFKEWLEGKELNRSWKHPNWGGARRHKPKFPFPKMVMRQFPDRIAIK